MNDIIDNLREAARYARTQPGEAERLAELVYCQLVQRIWPKNWGWKGARLANNISAGIQVIHANPDMLASYCRCAADELAMWADRMERQSKGGTGDT